MKQVPGVRLIVAAVSIMAGLVLTPARAAVVVQIDKSSQRMTVRVDGSMRYNWPVSTGRRGYGTPSGTFRRLKGYLSQSRMRRRISETGNG